MKTLTFSVTSETGTLTRTVDLPDAATWTSIAYVFWEFLRGMGYYVDHEDVGADPSSFIEDIEDFEDRGL